MEIMEHKNYKCERTPFSMENKKGQVALFVIIAIVIVGIVLILLFYKKLPISVTSGELSPNAYLKSCIEPELDRNVEVLGNSAGYSNPEGYITYKDEKIKYLCYTAEYYKTCIVQQPLIKEHFEQELNSVVKSKANECVQSLKQEYEKRGYDITLSKIDSRVSINPGNILVSISAPMTVKKAGSSQSFSGFDIKIDSAMYDLLMTSVSIIDFESTLGDSETTDYMLFYPDLKIEKTRLSDGSKIYSLTNVVTNESFRFASRSISWPPGYGLDYA
jgi:hypothetical protein